MQASILPGPSRLRVLNDGARAFGLRNVIEEGRASFFCDCHADTQITQVSIWCWIVMVNHRFLAATRWRSSGEVSNIQAGRV